MIESVSIVCVDLQGKFLNEFPSINYASRNLGIYTRAINNCLYGKSMRTGKYFFILKEYYNPKKDYSYKHRKYIKSVKSNKVSSFKKRNIKIF